VSARTAVLFHASDGLVCKHYSQLLRIPSQQLKYWRSPI